MLSALQLPSWKGTMQLYGFHRSIFVCKFYQITPPLAFAVDGLAPNRNRWHRENKTTKHIFVLRWMISISISVCCYHEGLMSLELAASSLNASSNRFSFSRNPLAVILIAGNDFQMACQWWMMINKMAQRFDAHSTSANKEWRTKQWNMKYPSNKYSSKGWKLEEFPSSHVIKASSKAFLNHSVSTQNRTILNLTYHSLPQLFGFTSSFLLVCLKIGATQMQNEIQHSVEWDDYNPRN